MILSQVNSSVVSQTEYQHKHTPCNRSSEVNSSMLLQGIVGRPEPLWTCRWSSRMCAAVCELSAANDQTTAWFSPSQRLQEVNLFSLDSCRSSTETFKLPFTVSRRFSWAFPLIPVRNIPASSCFKEQKLNFSCRGVKGFKHNNHFRLR